MGDRATPRGRSCKKNNNLHTAAKAGPITYMHNGKQYIVQALGGLPGFGRDEAHNAEFGSVVVGFSR